MVKYQNRLLSFRGELLSNFQGHSEFGEHVQKQIRLDYFYCIASSTKRRAESSDLIDKRVRARF